MKNEAMYRRLAADGNKDAQAILDAELDSPGSVPAVEATDEGSEHQELVELTALQTQVNAMVAGAEERAEAEGTEGEESGETESEESSTDDLIEFAEKVGALKAKADILAAAGDNKGAADTHMNRAREFDWRGQYAEGMAAYRDAAYAYSKHADEACAQLTTEQVKSWLAQRSTAV